MRVQGNVYPETITIEGYLPVPGMVEVRMRENVVQLSDTMYEYDEYITHLKNRPDLKAEIESNLTDWMTTLRTLEVNENASIVAGMRNDISAYEQALSEIEAALGVTT